MAAARSALENAASAQNAVHSEGIRAERDPSRKDSAVVPGEGLSYSATWAMRPGAFLFQRYQG